MLTSEAVVSASTVLAAAASISVHILFNLNEYLALVND